MPIEQKTELLYKTSKVKILFYYNSLAFEDIDSLLQTSKLKTLQII